MNAESPGERERGDATPFDDLNQLLAELVVGAKEVLDDSFCGAYLQGSLLDSHDDTVVVRWLLREHGVVVAGPDPHELVDPITADELRERCAHVPGGYRQARILG